MLKKTFLLITLIATLLVPGCKKKPDKKSELLIYCGITMIRPMKEIAEIIEKKNNCIIKIAKGASGNLLQSLKINKLGDLYLPGSETYMQKCKADGLLIGAPLLVGYNQAAMMVAKGNPKKVKANLDELLKPEYTIVLGNPETGSIGKETQKILSKKGIEKSAYKKALYFTTDSKDLTKAIRDRKADIVINWRAISCQRENNTFLEALGISEKYATKKKLLIGLLKFSKNKKTASKFIDYACSPKGRKIFKKHGFQ